jgi:hypothetical protein
MACGVAVGALLALPGVGRAWYRGQALARPLGRLLLCSYGAGLWALGPHLLTGRLGLPEATARSPWMNLFVLHPLIERHEAGGLLVGEVALGLSFVGHYLLLLVALRRAHRRSAPPGEDR